jgi:hypothetical protein
MESEIKPQLKIILATACDERYAKSALQLIGSIQKFSPIFDKIYLYDLGIPKHFAWCFKNIKGVEVRKVEKFKEDYLLHWGWKPWVFLNTPGEIVVYLDAGVEALGNLQSVVDAVKQDDYFVVSQHGTLAKGHTVEDIIPTDYYKKYKVPNTIKKKHVVAGGIVGFKSNSEFRTILEETFQGVLEGDNIGWSVGDAQRNVGINKITSYKPKDCPHFRHDQTLFNISFYKHIENPVIHDLQRYANIDGPNEVPGQLLWQSRWYSKYQYIDKLTYTKHTFLHNLFNRHHDMLANVYFGIRNRLKPQKVAE